MLTQTLLSSLLQVLNDVHAGRYIHGVAVHWYMDKVVPAEISLGITHHLYPEYYLFGTEACAGWSPTDRGVKLGSWSRAEQYAHDIIEVRSSYLSMRVKLVQQNLPEQMWGLTSCELLHKGESPPLMLQCRFTSRCLLHTLSSNCLQAISKLELAFTFFYLHSLIKKIVVPPLCPFCIGAFRIQTCWKSRGICLCRCADLTTRY